MIIMLLLGLLLMSLYTWCYFYVKDELLQVLQFFVVLLTGFVTFCFVILIITSLTTSPNSSALDGLIKEVILIEGNV